MHPLYLGVGRSVITPEIGGNLYGYFPDVFSESVADDLTVTVFCFRQEETVSMMITVTVGNIRTDIMEELRTEIEARCGVPKSNILLCSTHTHSGPNLAGPDPGAVAGWGTFDRTYYESIFRPAFLAAAEQAAGSLEPVTVGSASGSSLVGINRRQLTLDNRIILGQNPWGSFNPKMTVLSFRRGDGTIAANLIHYGCHGTSAGVNHEISRDWSGVMTDRLETLTGGVTAFFNGPEGDVGPRLTNGKTTGDLSHVHALGAIAAEDAVRIFGEIRSYQPVALRVCEGRVELPLQPRLPKAEAEAMLARYGSSTRNLDALLRNWAEKVLQSYAADEPEAATRGFDQTAVALGNTVFLAFPYELFSEIGMRIDQAFPDADILSLANTNQKMGYFATQDALCRGGYEISSCRYNSTQPYSDDADWHLVRESLRQVEAVLNTTTTGKDR